MILIADSDYETQNLIAQYVKELCSHDVVTISNGRDALRKAVEESFSLIIIDDELPLMDGLEVVRQIRAIEHIYSDHRMILGMCRKFCIERRLEALDIGVDEHISKPIEKDEFERILKRCLKGSTLKFLEKLTRDKKPIFTREK